MADKSLGGLYNDSRPQEQPPGTYPFAKNGVQHDTKGAVKNEPGFLPLSVPVPGEVIGVIETDDSPVIFSVGSDGEQSISYVGKFNRRNNLYVPVKNDSEFPKNDKWGFSRDHYITGEFQRNHLNEGIVVWTDKVRFPFILNVDNPRDITSARDTYFFLQSATPNLIASADKGGILAKGAYFVFAKYLKNDGSETGYIANSAPVIISSPQAGDLTDQAIRIEISSLDQRYDKVQFAIVSRIGGVYTASELQPFEVSDGAITVFYTGENVSSTITLDEILVPNASYVRVGTIGQLNDALYLADLEKAPEPNYQRWANVVKLRVKSELIDVVPQTADHVSGKKRSLMHQEVYAAYIRYHKTTGTWTRAFHIPGNAPQSSDLAAAGLAHEAELEAKVFQVRDTTKNVDRNLRTVDTGIWINEDEVYPTTDDFDSVAMGGEDLRGLPVRHHRMPSLAWCKENFYPGDASYGRTRLDLLGLEVSNVQYPEDDIDGYEIMIAKRSIANSTVLGQSLLLLSGQSKDLSATQKGFVSTGGNWHSDPVGKAKEDTHGPFDDPDTIILTGRDRNSARAADVATPRPGLRFRLHSFDMLFNKPAVTPAYISPQLKMRINNFQDTFPTGAVVEDGESGDHDRRPIIYVCDYTKGVAPTAVPTTVRTRAVEGTRYLQNNVDTGEWNNKQQETCFVGKVKWLGPTTASADNDIPLSIPKSTVNLTYWQRRAQTPTHHETYLTNVMDLKRTLYSTFYSQPLVSSGQFVPRAAFSSVVYPGDVFLNDYTFHTYGWTGGWNTPGDDSPDPNTMDGYKVAHRFICEAASNINLRYEEAGNLYSKWWPNSPLTAQKNDATDYLYLFERDKDPNQFGYNRDLNTLNDFGNYSVYNPYYEDITSFPFRVHRGGKLPRQGKIRSWRTLLPLDYHEAQKNMGRIIRLLGKDDRLIIHHENSLFVTQDKAKLEAGMLSVTLGAGDIFQFEPQEALSSKHGYAGTQHELAAIDTPIGYVFPDAKTGQVFLFKDGVKLMNAGLNAFFREYLRDEANNPFIGNGITVGYDPELKRIMLTVKNKKVVAEHFVPDFSPTPDFIAKLTPGLSVVYKDGRYQTYLGVNGTQYECPTNYAPTATTGFVTIPENTPNGSLIGTITGLFSDTDNDILTYSIVGGNTGTSFVVDRNSGEVRVNNEAMLDYEVRSQYTLVVRATDDDGAWVDTTYTVSLTPVNEPPVTRDYEWEVDENIPDGTTIGQVIATDPEGEALSYSILTPGVPFIVDPATGLILKQGTLDYEDRREWEFVVRVADPEGLEAFSNITVFVRNVNEAPVGVDGVITVYKDKTPLNTIIWTTVVSDSDIPSTLVVEWTNKAEYESLFSYNLETGEVTALDPSALVPGSQYILSFKVTDEDGMTDTFKLTVNAAITQLQFVAQDYTCEGVGCPPGYTLSPDQSACIKMIDTPATPPESGTPILTAARDWFTYGSHGTVVYRSGFSVDGTGLYDKINTANAFWRNTPQNRVNGPLNRSGLWAVDSDGNGVDDPVNSRIGFSIPVNIPAKRLYLIGIAGDNMAQIRVDGQVIVSQSPTALDNSMATAEGIAKDGTIAFRLWHVYPVEIEAGQHYIELTGINQGQVGAFGAEIYDATFQELEAATSYTDLGAKLIFSTKDVRGQALQLGGGTAYTCPEGYSLVKQLDNSYICRQVLTTPVTGGYTKTISTIKVLDSEGNHMATLNNIPNQKYLGQVVPYMPNETNSEDCGYIPAG